MKKAVLSRALAHYFFCFGAYIELIYRTSSIPPFSIGAFFKIY